MWDFLVGYSVVIGLLVAYATVVASLLATAALFKRRRRRWQQDTERYTWERYLREKGAKIVHRDGSATLVELPNEGQRRFCTCNPETGRKYVLLVPPEVSTCEEARRWVSHI